MPRMEVYPRECGGTLRIPKLADRASGLSPRVRGNRNRHRSRACSRRSIPASAGEPPFGTPPCPPRRVYPRECGGTQWPILRPTTSQGLSPRVRGNLLARVAGPAGAGSILASAGEPPSISRGCRSPRVYPRECGGTTCRVPVMRWISGLSPRVRGNRDRVVRTVPRLGSIPASAGEPTWRRSRSTDARVYPRECGGTKTGMNYTPRNQGLSPRVRGNRAARRGPPVGGGSIPASAGEPAAPAFRRRFRKVYPRECGGTASRRRSS